MLWPLGSGMTLSSVFLCCPMMLLTLSTAWSVSTSCTLCCSISVIAVEISKRSHACAHANIQHVPNMVCEAKEAATRLSERLTIAAPGNTICYTVT